MNNIVNKYLLVGHRFIPEMYLKQCGFTQSACGPFTKNKEFKRLKNRRFKIHIQKWTR